MSREKNTNNSSKDRIFETATNLFARKSYSSVGVREIAAEAEVNISMISYYFGGKIGILKAIVDEYFEKIEAILSASFSSNESVDKSMKLFFHSLVNFFRRDTNLCLVWFSEANNEIPEIAENRLKKGEMLHELGIWMHKKIGFDPEKDDYIIKILGPVILNMAISHFIHKPIQEHVIETEFDDEFFATYADTLANLFLNGAKGILADRSK